MYYGDHTILSRNPNPGDRIREYEIIETIGKGGMSTVYKARHTMIDQIVAIKIMKPSLMDDQQFCERFVREAQAQAKLCGHPNIVTIHNLFEEDNLYIIIMEYIEGMLADQDMVRTLAQFIDNRGRLRIDQFKPILLNTLAGLEFAHQQNVVHRDIKPSNIMLMSNRSAKIADFGIARIIADQRLTKTGIVIGTPKYMSPEQVRSGEIDARSDIYSLGVTIYEALAGIAPFKGDTDYEIMRQHEETTPPPPRAIAPGIPEEWENLILRCIAKDPEERFQSIGDIKQLLAGKRIKKPVLKTLPQTGYDTMHKQPSRFHKKKAKKVTWMHWSMIGVLFTLLVIAYFVFSHLSRRDTSTKTAPIDSLASEIIPQDVILEKYADIGTLVTTSQYVVSAYIMCNEDNLHEIIIQLMQDEPGMVYIHFTDNEHQVVASSNESVIGAEYRSDFLNAAENAVRKHNNFYEGAFTIRAENNVLGAFFFTARSYGDDSLSPHDLEVLRYTSIGKLIAHAPDVEEAVINNNAMLLNDIIQSLCNQVADLDYVHIANQECVIIASSDTVMLQRTLVAEPSDSLSQHEHLNNNSYYDEFSIEISDIQIGTLVLGARLPH